MKNLEQGLQVLGPALLLGQALVPKDLGLVQKDLGLVQKDLGLVQKDLGLVQKDLLVQKDQVLGQQHHAAHHFPEQTCQPELTWLLRELMRSPESQSLSRRCHSSVPKLQLRHS
jgi:hypothetical protein